VNLLTLAEMAATGMPSRVAVGQRPQPARAVRGRPGAAPPDRAGLTYQDLLCHARAGARVVRDGKAEDVVYLGANGDAFPLALFAAAWAGVPLVPLNYRLGRDQLAGLLEHHPKALVISDVDLPTSAKVISSQEWRSACAAPAADLPRWQDAPDAVAVLIYTSGTTSSPRAAVLRHRHLTAYVLGSVEFGAADERDAMLVSVPPYHIAGVCNLLSSIYAGRRVVYLESFTPEAWLERVRVQQVSHALVVPTMLTRLTDHLGDADAGVPSLRSLAYGGARMSATVLDRALRLLPSVDFVNAYGLTETSSTLAVLGPDDHRAALAGDPAARARLSSAGRVLPGIEVQVRGPGGILPPGEPGDIYVRGAQVSGEYREQGNLLDTDGWFATRDRGWIDSGGYLFVEGRTDDTIIRGGENIAPAEIEEVLLEHAAVADAAVVGVPDQQWGQEIAAAVVLRPGQRADAEDLREWVRERLRSSKTPATIMFPDELPRTPTGKILRREILASLAGQRDGPA
jgi:acyl-CoA synthetase (AMP-forming)/AMP-acid ligase II